MVQGGQGRGRRLYVARPLQLFFTSTYSSVLFTSWATKVADADTMLMLHAPAAAAAATAAADADAARPCCCCCC
jgi:hypothetical protein